MCYGLSPITRSLLPSCSPTDPYISHCRSILKRPSSDSAYYQFLCQYHQSPNIISLRLLNFPVHAFHSKLKYHILKNSCLNLPNPRPSKLSSPQTKLASAAILLSLSDFSGRFPMDIDLSTILI